jgi:hypothetical protein
MSAIIRTTFRILNARNFIGYVMPVGNNSLYAAIGRNRPWADEANPPTPGDILADDKARWEDIYALKRILPTNVSFVVPRYNWVSGATNFTPYVENDSAIFTKRFYCINSEYRVYKLLTKGPGASTVMPTGESATNNYVQQLSDGYVWKFMYQVTAAEALQFLSTSWMPVKTLTINDNSTQWLVQLNANNNPNPGHGADAVYELGGFNVMFDMQFQYNEGGAFSVTNDFRAISIILNPTLFGTNTVATENAIRQSRTMVLTNVSGTFVPDEIIESSTGAQGQVINQNGSSLYYLLSSSLNTGTGFAATQTITGQTSRATATITSIAPPALNLASGTMLFVDNRKAISRAPDQAEDVKVVLVF